MRDKKSFYVTTPIYYPSDNLHIGHAYCSVAADAMARHKKLTGHDVYFLTGTDEHGQKIEARAKEAGVSPQQFVDKIVAGIKELWTLMDVEYDGFIRTTDEKHMAVIQKIFTQLYEQGDIYKGEYEGWYCTPCEAHWTETQLKDGKCADCGRPVNLVREQAYFLRTSKYQDWLIQYIEDNPDFIEPKSRANEMLTNFLRPGLADLCVSRTSFSWGVPVPFDPAHVVYVWIDALSNYITALGYGSDDDTLYHKFWPADVQLVGKEIIRFHTIYWPILLKALGLPLPKKVFGHGWLVFGGEKMSKSLGNVVDPTVLCERYSSDALRYYLLREMTFGADGNFTNESLLTRMNADLSNDLGNLVSRTVAMVEKYFGGDVPVCGALSDLDEALRHTATSLPGAVDTQMEALQYSAALAEIWKLVGDCNQYIDANKPWVLANNEADRPRLGTVLYHLLECIRIVAVLVGPFMPRTPEKIFKQIGLSGGSLGDWESLRSFGRLPAGARVKKGDALFPRFDIQKELTALEALKPAPETKTDPAPEKPPVAMDEFDKIALKVAFVTACEKVPKSDKLLKFTLRVGAEERTVLSGIAGHYEPEALVGKRIVLLSNLQPRMIRGTLSQGMVLSAEGADGTVRLLTVDGEVADGSDIS